MGNNNLLTDYLMRAFTSALLAIGAYAANTKSAGPWDVMMGEFGPPVKQGSIGLNTDWSKTGG